MNKALIVIDIQNEYFEHGGMELVNPVPASIQAGKIIQRFREKGLPIVHIQHISADPIHLPFFIEGTEFAEIHANVKPLPNEVVIRKHFPNGFRETGLLNYLKENKITELVVVGMMTHMCIDATTRAAVDLGYTCTVIDDACATLDLEINGKCIKADDVHQAFLAALAFFYANIQSTEKYLAEN
ncbi:cysteine hydrolase [Sphingobacterium sp. N143]|uniref:cysteine hydrolase family protein n=1 Tax=Sphingobacterium sp. N143 TaxID=2746727 RepID=UPI002575C9B5|nr:cysteine hydrolase family protein [Sphingobacterium sp. N143]MDM1293036.1 cysteine hydrolase [Sphingobacterium sp. N143]